VYGGAIIICNRLTKRDFFQYKLFALPGYATTFIKKIRAGMLLFLFEFEERKLYGVFEAASDGALDILPDAFASLWKFRPAQVSMLLLLSFVFWLLPVYWFLLFAGLNMNCAMLRFSRCILQCIICEIF
jgi:hypothetical protein